MRRLSTVVTAVFFLMAALLGWFLPLADFNVYDQISEGSQKDLEIKQINLTYRDDLTMNQKINIAYYESAFEDAIDIDRGIYVQEDELARIIGDFLADFTGYRFDVANSWIAVPKLVYLNNRGTIVVWRIELFLDENWEFECYVDDMTGAILRCAFYGDPDCWDDLVHGIYDAEDPFEFLSNKYRTAVYNHYASRLNAKIVTYHKVGDSNYGEVASYLFVFKDDKNYTFELPVSFYLPYGRIEPY